MRRAARACSEGEARGAGAETLPALAEEVREGRPPVRVHSGRLLAGEGDKALSWGRCCCPLPLRPLGDGEMRAATVSHGTCEFALFNGGVRTMQLGFLHFPPGLFCHPPQV